MPGVPPLTHDRVRSRNKSENTWGRFHKAVQFYTLQIRASLVLYSMPRSIMQAETSFVKIELTRPDLGHLAIEIKKRIDKIRQEIRSLQENGDQTSKSAL